MKENKQEQILINMLMPLRGLLFLIGTLGIAAFFFYMMAEQESGRTDFYWDFFTKPIFPMLILGPFIGLYFINRQLKRMKRLKDRV